MPQLCSDVVLGQDFQEMYDSIMLKYEGGLPPLIICGLNTLKVDPAELFTNLMVDCYPIFAKSYQYTFEERLLIEKETQMLLKKGVIENSNST